ncbi:MAG TPA: ferredoxin family protein [Chthonomonadaceae bacterium]|nr:ferredoxin family protein [Chthonomonadaceae bacterium]
MAYVITEPCVSVKDRGCVAVCPVDCIHEGVYEQGGTTYDMLFIDPEECIDCGICEAECPVGAIFLDVDVPERYQPYIEINAVFTRTLQPARQ